jgi:hypothetical protein
VCLAVVREYVIALHSPEELVLLQQKAVDAFCQHRPNSQDPLIHRLPIWRAFGEPLDECGQYVIDQIAHHISSGLDLTDTDDSVPQCAHAWIYHWPGMEFRADGIFDAVTINTWQALGAPRLLSLFSKAVADEDWWLALCAGGLGGYTYVRCMGEDGFRLVQCHLPVCLPVYGHACLCSQRVRRSVR